MDSTSIQFIVVSEPESLFPECDIRDILFEIFTKTDICKRFDKSNKFWKKCNVDCPENEKVLGLYEVEHIDDPCYVTLAVNPKEYYEYFKTVNSNKKHKGIKKGSPGMEYENYAERIKPLIDFKTYKKPKPDIKDVVRISVKREKWACIPSKKISFHSWMKNDFIFQMLSFLFHLDIFHLQKLTNIRKTKVKELKSIFGQTKKNF